jgi:SAM-dependent methyltransferase
MPKLPARHRTSATHDPSVGSVIGGGQLLDVALEPADQHGNHACTLGSCQPETLSETQALRPLRRRGESCRDSMNPFRVTAAAPLQWLPSALALSVVPAAMRMTWWKTAQVEYDPTQFSGAARYYRQGRPPYSARLADVVARELGLDGSGQLLDVGSGPGTVGLQLAHLFEGVTLLEPDADMLAEARLHAEAEGLSAVDFIRATAEELPDLKLSPMRAVTFGQSFHRTNRIRVAEAVYDALEPAGALVLITHDPTRRPPQQPPNTSLIPHDEVDRLISAYLGPERRSGDRLAVSYGSERFEDTLARTRFGRPRVVYAPGRPDIVRDVDGVVAGFLSTSFAAPRLFGPRLEDFITELRALLERHSASGYFWDWPGDTALLIANRR